MARETPPLMPNAIKNCHIFFNPSLKHFTLLTSPVLMMPRRGSSRIGSNEVTWEGKCRMQKTAGKNAKYEKPAGKILNAKCKDEN